MGRRSIRNEHKEIWLSKKRIWSMHKRRLGSATPETLIIRWMIGTLKLEKGLGSQLGRVRKTKNGSQVAVTRLAVQTLISDEYKRPTTYRAHLYKQCWGRVGSPCTWSSSQYHQRIGDFGGQLATRRHVWHYSEGSGGLSANEISRVPPNLRDSRMHPRAERVDSNH